MQQPKQQQYGSVGVIHELVEELVQSMTGKKSKTLTQLSMRILSSRIEAKSTETSFVADKIKKSLVQRAKDKSDLTVAMKFQELQAKLRKYDNLKRQGSIMSLLYSLMDVSDSPINLSKEFGSVQIAKRVPSDSFELKPPPAPMVRPSTKPKRLVQPIDTEEISENDLIRDVLYAFQGIESKYIVYSSDSEGYVIRPEIVVSSPMRYLVSKLCEMGWMYSRISAYLKRQSPNQTFGVVGQSLCSVIQTELADYYRLIAILESQLDGDEKIESEITMRRLLVWVQDPMDRIRFLACLVDSVSEHRGGALTSGVFTYIRHGDPFIRNFVEKIVREISTPLFTMIQNWVLEGILEDPHKEFFVSADPSISNEHLWIQKYSINYAMLPTFISKDLAQRIFIIGKSINFIRHCCNDTEWVMDSVVSDEELGFSDLDKLETVITQASTVTNKYLINILMKKYQLLDHCRALKQYLLLGQGDFIQCLMDQVGDELSKRPSQIYRHNLMTVLDSALNSSNAKYESPEITNRLDVKLLPSSAGDDGWDVFLLHYKVSSPLNTVIDESSMNGYLQIFHLLWRLKRVEYSLSSTWNRDMISEHSIRTRLPELRGTLHQAYLLRNEMIHFTANLLNYMMFEVLETSWHSLLENMHQARDLDELIAAHTMYLARIKQNALMTDSSKSILQQVKCIFDIVIKFCKIHELVYTSASREAHCRKMREAQGEWSSTSRDHNGIGPQLLTQLREISKEYVSHFESLLTMLTNQCSESEYLRFLTFRLNFNEFYTINKAE